MIVITQRDRAIAAGWRACANHKHERGATRFIEFAEAYHAVMSEVAESAPSDAEVEAMAERLWDVFRREAACEDFILLHWSDLLDAGRDGTDRLVTIFRAMARVALERP